MKRTWPIIGVEDVQTSCRWYLALLGLDEEAHSHDNFAMVCDTDGTVVVCVHAWGGHDEGPPLQGPSDGTPGNGCLLFIRVDDFDDTLLRARDLGLRFETEPEVFVSGPQTRAFTVRDPDGYYVTVNEIRPLPGFKEFP